MNPEPRVQDSRGRHALLKLLENTSQEEVEAASGVHQSIISLIVNLQRLPGRKASVGLAKLGIEPAWWDEPAEPERVAS